jgi:hypothetical protein
VNFNRIRKNGGSARVDLIKKCFVAQIVARVLILHL